MNTEHATVFQAHTSWCRAASMPMRRAANPKTRRVVTMAMHRAVCMQAPHMYCLPCNSDLGQGVLQQAHDRAAQRPRAIRRVVALVHQAVLQGRDTNESELDRRQPCSSPCIVGPWFQWGRAGPWDVHKSAGLRVSAGAVQSSTFSRTDTWFTLYM